MKLLINFEEPREQQLQFHLHGGRAFNPVRYFDDSNLLPSHTQCTGIVLPVLLSLIGLRLAYELVIAQLIV